MTTIKFVAPEYQEDRTFKEYEFEFRGDEKTGWVVKRNGQTISNLGCGYTPVQSYYCTDRIKSPVLGIGIISLLIVIILKIFALLLLLLPIVPKVLK